MPPTDPGRGLDASYPAQAAQVPVIRRAVNGVARGYGADDETLTKIGLAVTEAATNVVLHAYRSPREHERIYVRARVAGEFLSVTVRDNGVGMSPRADSPGLGLGLSLIAHESERCEIRPAHGGGTEVLMRFSLGEHAGDEPWRHSGFNAAGAGAFA